MIGVFLVNILNLVHKVFLAILSPKAVFGIIDCAKLLFFSKRNRRFLLNNIKDQNFSRILFEI